MLLSSLILQGVFIKENLTKFPFTARNLEFYSFPADSKAETSRVVPLGDHRLILILQLEEHQFTPNVKHQVGLNAKIPGL